jgi:DNA-binding NtrC family response regulator
MLHRETSAQGNPGGVVALDRHGWHMSHTAEALGITRKTVWEKMRRLGIQPKEDA